MDAGFFAGKGEIMKIKRIFFDWYYTQDDVHYASYSVGKDGVVEITKEECNHVTYFRVFFKNGNYSDIYNINQVDWEKEEK